MDEGSYYEEWIRLEREIDEILKAKKEKDLLEQLSVKPEILKPGEIRKPTEPVSEYFYEKLRTTTETIEKLAEEIRTRKEFTDRFLYQLDYEIREAAFSLEQFKTWGIGYNTGVDVKRNFLERMLANLRKERRATELRAWEDIITLRKDMREALSEYRELLRRDKLVEER